MSLRTFFFAPRWSSLSKVLELLLPILDAKNSLLRYRNGFFIRGDLIHMGSMRKRPWIGNWLTQINIFRVVSPGSSERPIQHRLKTARWLKEILSWSLLNSVQEKGKNRAGHLGSLPEHCVMTPTMKSHVTMMFIFNIYSLCYFIIKVSHFLKKGTMSCCRHGPFLSINSQSWVNKKKGKKSHPCLPRTQGMLLSSSCSSCF